MAKIVWDQTGERFYETGTDRGVLYPAVNGAYPKGVAWNGLTGVDENPSGAEESKFFADNIKYLGLRSAEDFGATVTAYTYPDEFAACDGSATPTPGLYIGQQTRKPFGMSYRTKVGNDVAGDDLGYKINLVYGATASPSQRSYKTVNDSPEPIEFSWELATTPVAVEIENLKPAAHLTIDSRTTPAEKLKALEDILYGTENEDARLPLPKEVYELLSAA